MAEELQVISPDMLIENPGMPARALQQQGEKNIYAEHVENMNVTLQVAPQVLKQDGQSMPATFDRTHYNLFVTFDLDFVNGFDSFTMDTDRSLKEYMSDELRKEFSTLSDEAIERIKRFPCIFANENTEYGRADEDQMLGFGYIRQIKVRREKIKIYPAIMYLFPQQRLNEALFELDISGSSSFNEFNRTHWCIKKVDLIAELRELGFQI